MEIVPLYKLAPYIFEYHTKIQCNKYRVWHSLTEKHPGPNYTVLKIMMNSSILKEVIIKDVPLNK